jgi:peptidoglycan/LPS O-acetylase OafA/YrhL
VLGLRTRIAPTSNVLPFILLALLYASVLGASHLMYVLVEAPCLALASRLKHRSAPATEPAT